MNHFLTYYSDTLYYHIALPLAALVVGAAVGHAYSKTGVSRGGSIAIGAVLGVVAVLVVEFWRYALFLCWFDGVSIDTALSLAVAGVMFIVVSFLCPVVPLAAGVGSYLGHSVGARKRPPAGGPGS